MKQFSQYKKAYEYHMRKGIAHIKAAWSIMQENIEEENKIFEDEMIWIGAGLRITIKEEDNDK